MTQDQKVKSEGLEQMVKMPAVSYKLCNWPNALPFLSLYFFIDNSYG